ncbi:MAG: 7-carboxy-7-deazaguanine synthase QueE [Rikenellaceae bacterium]
MTKSDEISMESMCSLPINEAFYSLQGEGCNSGQAAYFIRLGGCDVACEWCDSPQAQSGGEMTPIESIVQDVLKTPAHNVVITGGEPSLHNLEPLTTLLKEQGKRVMIETSGTNPLSGTLDWVCLSPKPHYDALCEVYAQANELKVVIAKQEDFEFAERCALRVSGSTLLYLQCEWGARADLTNSVIEYIKKNPKWRLSLQTHKFLNIL